MLSKLKHRYSISVDSKSKCSLWRTTAAGTHIAQRFQGCWIRKQLCPWPVTHLQIRCSPQALPGYGRRKFIMNKPCSMQRASHSAIKVLSSALAHLCCHLVITDWRLLSSDLKLVRHYHCPSLFYYSVDTTTAPCYVNSMHNHVVLCNFVTVRLTTALTTQRHLSLRWKVETQTSWLGWRTIT